jgi:hypothetical protein
MRNEDTGDGLSLIAAERWRQVEVEGYQFAHDDAHDEGELAIAAACYAASSANEQLFIDNTGNREGDAMVDPWPFEKALDKRLKHNRMKKLAIAGALIAAELDRLLRIVDRT